MQKVQWGIIGCGNVTEVKSGPAFNKVAHSRLVAVMRRDAAKAADYARRHGVPKWYSDAQQLIDDPDVTAVYIATPPLYHEEYTLAALTAGKPVYVEKPMALHVGAAEGMQHAALASGVKVSVAHYRRQQPLFLKVKELLMAGAIGDIRMINMQLLQPYQSAMIAQTDVNWRIDPKVSGGGLFHDLAPHGLDLMICFFGTAVKATGSSVNNAGYYAADDGVTGTVLFQNKALFTGTWCFAVPPGRQRDVCELIGSEGTLSFSVFDHKPLVVTIGEREEVFHFDKLEHVQQPMIAEVVRYFRGERDNPCSVEEGVAVMKLMDSFTGKG